MGKPTCLAGIRKEANLGKWNISVPRGKEITEIPQVVVSEKGLAQTL